MGYTLGDELSINIKMLPTLVSNSGACVGLSLPSSWDILSMNVNHHVSLGKAV